ncbi:hypothetical protein OHR68_33870 [Spirillospora sp. NBC_00431]
MSGTRPPGGEPRRDFYGIAEIADAIGVNRQLVTAWRRRRSHGMPDPDAELAAGPLWRGESIEAWIETVRARLTAGPGAPVSAEAARRTSRRVLRLLALLLEDHPRPRLVARALAEVRELLPLVADGDDTDPIVRELRRLLAPVADAPSPDFAKAMETDADDGKVIADYTVLRTELLAALPVLPELLNAAESAEGGSRAGGGPTR